MHWVVFGNGIVAGNAERDAVYFDLTILEELSVPMRYGRRTRRAEKKPNLL